MSLQIKPQVGQKWLNSLGNKFQLVELMNNHWICNFVIDGQYKGFENRIEYTRYQIDTNYFTDNKLTFISGPVDKSNITYDSRVKESAGEIQQRNPLVIVGKQYKSNSDSTFWEITSTRWYPAIGKYEVYGRGNSMVCVRVLGTDEWFAANHTLVSDSPTSDTVKKIAGELHLPVKTESKAKHFNHAYDTLMEKARLEDNYVPPSSALKCRHGERCKTCYPNKAEPFIPNVTDLDLLPDA